MTDRTNTDVSIQQAAARGKYRPSRMMRLLLGFASAIRIGSLTMILPDGAVHRFKGPDPGPDGVIHIHQDRFARRMLTGGRLGFCESYLDGDWSSPDTPSLFEMALRNEEALAQVFQGRGWYRFVARLAHALKPNTRSGSRRNIAAHYDLGNAFYEQWLDPSMTYSSAVYADLAAAEDLSAAQTRKYAEIARRMDLRADHHVLEIGCGWGGFAEHAAKVVGARVTAITISKEQHAFATERMRRQGLQDRVEIRLQDYRDTTGRFDRIASIEMFEAVGERYWPAFFATVRDRLVEGGKACLQVITIEEKSYERYRTGADYIQRYIFPGGMLPSPPVLKGEVEKAGLSWLHADGFGLHYARTLAEWQVKFQAAWPELRALGFDDRFKRMWEQYLWYCEAGFKVGTIDVLQVAVGRD